MANVKGNSVLDSLEEEYGEEIEVVLIEERMIVSVTNSLRDKV